MSNDATAIISDFDSPEEIAKRQQEFEDAMREYAKTDLQKRQQLRDASKMQPEEFKKFYNEKYGKDVAEDMTEKLAPSIDEFKRAAKIDKLKSLAKGVGSNLVKGAALGMALEPSEMAVSELPNTQEGLDQLEGEMRMKNAPYNYPTRFNQLRKKLER
jgi:hypothetical protein